MDTRIERAKGKNEGGIENNTFLHVYTWKSSIHEKQETAEKEDKEILCTQDWKHVEPKQSSQILHT